jgi:multiple sugar transport system substrate-binding protein
MTRILLACLLAVGAVVGGGARADTKLQLVEVITSPERTAVLKKIVAGFEQANPGITVNIVSLPWGQAFEKMLTMVQGGDVPDVAEMPERWLSLYANHRQLESLEPYLAKWSETGQLTDRTLQFGRSVDNTAYQLPYGFYIRALFWDKKLFQQAGIDGPPRTMDDFMADSAKISKLDGKYGYCLRGSKGGFGGWQMFMAAYNGTGAWFTPDGKSTFDQPGSIKGLQFMVDLYQKGYAPKDSVNWGFNEVVAGFYSGTCAMLDQDPDALIAVASRMDNKDFAVAPMPLGPSGKAFPTIGWAGWSMFRASPNKDAAWKLIAWLSNAENNLTWSKFVGVIPTHKEAQNDPHYRSDLYAGWFKELNDPRWVLTPLPAGLEKLGYFYDVLAIPTAQQMLLGQKSPADVAAQWASFLTQAEQEARSKQQ